MTPGSTTATPRIEVRVREQPLQRHIDEGRVAALGGVSRRIGRRAHVEDEARQPWREHRVTGPDAPDGRGQLPPRDRLGDVAAGAAADGADDVLGGVGDRQGEELGFRAARRRPSSTGGRSRIAGNGHSRNSGAASPASRGTSARLRRHLASAPWHAAPAASCAHAATR